MADLLEPHGANAEDALGEPLLTVAGQRTLDALDLAIARAVERDARISLLELSRQVGTSRTTVTERLGRLIEQGSIRGFHARLDYQRLGYPITAFVAVQSQQSPQAFEVIEALKRITEVEEIHTVTGRFDLLVKVRARSTAHLQQILVYKIQTIPNIGRGETMLALDTHLEDAPIGLARHAHSESGEDDGATGRDEQEGTGR